jgi:hypothetical protein
MEETIRLRCPNCDGKLVIDEDYYKELVGHNINCPHCDVGMKIPSTVKKIKENQDLHGAHGRSQTHAVHKPSTTWTPPSLRQGEEEPAFCPKCKEEVGRRDRICISCGTKLTPAD